MAKRNLIAIATLSLALVFTSSAFGQKQRKSSFRPEVGDEVVITLRKKQVKSKTSPKTKVQNNKREISVRKKI